MGLPWTPKFPSVEPGRTRATTNRAAAPPVRRHCRAGRCPSRRRPSRRRPSRRRPSRRRWSRRHDAAGLLVLGLLAQATPASATDQRRALELGYAALSAATRDRHPAVPPGRRRPRRGAVRAGPGRTALPAPALLGRLLRKSFGWSRSRRCPAERPGLDGAGAALWRPRLDLDAACTALRSTGCCVRGGGALPRIYADNQATFGAGALARFWGGRAGASGRSAGGGPGGRRARAPAPGRLAGSVPVGGQRGLRRRRAWFPGGALLESYSEATYVAGTTTT